MDISSLRERRAQSELTVSELNGFIKNKLEGDRFFSAISVRGEISNFTYHRTGHLYFTLKDDESQIKAVMFRSSAASLKFLPENGMKVIVRCSVGVYLQSGNYQLYVSSMQPDGIGAYYLAYEQLKAKLEAEGLFDPYHKLEIPAIPSKIGVITAPGGAAVQDIINVISRRFPPAEIYIYPSLVQGEGAVPELIRAIDYFNASRLVDVIIIGRGGGSIEDLWAFNSEELARKIYDSQIPMISAVGHETDFTICDFVSDLRAPTPSAAAELAVPDYKELLLRLDTTHERIHSALLRSCERLEERFSRIRESLPLTDANFIFSEKDALLSEIERRALVAIGEKIKTEEARRSVLCGKLEVLSPLATLARGYSIAFANGEHVGSVKKVKNGDKISVRLSDGELDAKITEIKEF